MNIECPLGNQVIHIPDSKTEDGIADMPMTELAHQAFKAQINATPGFDHLSPTPSRKAKKPYISAIRKA